MRARPPAVAGMFYPADASVLAQTVLALLRDAEARVPGRPRALIVPHAGYPYSGAIAATAYRALAEHREAFERVVLLGPAHRVYLRGLALPSVVAFATPLGEVPLDTAALQRLTQLEGVVVSDEAHSLEHSLEVQLPFLRQVLDDFTLVPIVVGECQPELVADVLEAFVDDPATLIVVSSDLSHFHTYAEAKAIDGQTSAQITDRSHTLVSEQACGARAINGLTLLAARHGFGIIELERCNSGDTAGDHDRVVGYGAYAVC